MEKSKLQTIDIHGKPYITVSTRVQEFHRLYPNGSIRTKLLTAPESDYVIFKATVIPDVEKRERYFTGHSQATFGDKGVDMNAALENACTSAIGRALGFAGIGIVDGIASADEVVKAMTAPAKGKQNNVLGERGCPKCGVLGKYHVGASASGFRWEAVACLACNGGQFVFFDKPKAVKPLTEEETKKAIDDSKDSLPF